MEFNSVGTTGITVSDLCVGTSPLGGMPQTYGYSVEEARAVATVEAVFETAIDFMDTSNEYGKGESERRIGSVISAMGGLPDGFLMATKADPDGRDFSAERVRGRSRRAGSGWDSNASTSSTCTTPSGSRSR